MKVSGVQVSPSELEIALTAQPDRLIEDIAVAGVSGGRTSDEKVPRAWVVLSRAGKKRGAAATIKTLEEWSQQSLTKQKWLRGGIEVVTEVCTLSYGKRKGRRLTLLDCQIPKSPTGKVLRRVLQDAYEQRRKTGATPSKSKL